MCGSSHTSSDSTQGFLLQCYVAPEIQENQLSRVDKRTPKHQVCFGLCETSVLFKMVYHNTGLILPFWQAYLSENNNLLFKLLR